MGEDKLSAELEQMRQQMASNMRINPLLLEKIKAEVAAIEAEQEQATRQAHLPPPCPRCGTQSLHTLRYLLPQPYVECVLVDGGRAYRPGSSYSPRAGADTLVYACCLSSVHETEGMLQEVEIVPALHCIECCLEYPALGYWPQPE